LRAFGFEGGALAPAVDGDVQGGADAEEGEAGGGDPGVQLEAKGREEGRGEDGGGGAGGQPGLVGRYWRAGA
jgi:hypothetical protein